MGVAHVVAVLGYCVGSCGALAGFSLTWKVVRYVVCSSSRGIFLSIVLLSSLCLPCSSLLTRF
jgi:hypothetical protein